MKINKIHLLNYRNYYHTQLDFQKNIQVFVGDNGQGKTNLLESIYFLSTSRSFRVKNEQDLIQENFDLCRIEAFVSVETTKLRLAAILHQKGKSLFINKQPVRKTSEFVGKCNAILFSPADMDFFEASPKIRRRFIDIECSKISSIYMEQLSQYSKLLKERNSLLKTDKIDMDYLDVVTDSLTHLSIQIIKQRHEFVQFLQSKISTYYSSFVSEESSVTIQYQSSLGEILEFDVIKKRFESSFSRDKAFKMTHVGIHRDDLVFSLNGRFVSQFASQGQKRMILLSGKLSLIDYIYNHTKTYPILLLDDVFSELDPKKKLKFSEILPRGIQIMITTTDLSEISGWPKEECEIFTVSSGVVKPVKEVI